MTPAALSQEPGAPPDPVPGRAGAKMTERDILRASRTAAVFLGGLALLLSLRVVDGSAPLEADILIAAGGSLGLALSALALPWPRLGRWSTLVLPAIAFALFGLSLTAAESHPSSYLLYPFAGFVWLGLAYPPGVALRAVAPGLAVATIPALLGGMDPVLLASYPVVFLLGGLVAELLARIVAELRDALVVTRSSDRARASLIATLAHDLRSPAATVAGTMRLLHERGATLDEPTRERLLQAAERQSERLLDLADALLDSDRARAGALTLQRSEVDPFAVLDRAAWLSGVDLEVAGDPSLRVPADRRRLQHVLTNVLDNATRHGAPPVEAAVEASEGITRIIVRDHGPGVPEQLVESALDPFVHGGGEGSTGLGLWLVRTVVEAHHGQVRLESAEPGLRVVLELPSS